MAIASSNQIAHEAGSSPWHGFNTGLWQKEIDVRDFIQQTTSPTKGDESFLAPATERTKRIWARLNELFVEERKKGVLDVSQIPSSNFFISNTSLQIATLSSAFGPPSPWFYPQQPVDSAARIVSYKSIPRSGLAGNTLWRLTKRVLLQLLPPALKRPASAVRSRL
jgi:hypothetical protein